MPQSFDVSLVNPLLTAIVKAFDAELGMDISAESPYLKEERMAMGDISGVIAFKNKIARSLSISFSERCAKELVATLNSAPVLDLPTLREGVGELAKSIARFADEQFSALQFDISALPPIVIIGRKHVIKHVTDSGPVLAVPFRIPCGEFTVEICFANSAAHK